MSNSFYNEWFKGQGSGSPVRITTLPSSLLKFPPASLPATVPPPSDHPAFAHPFPIPVGIYNAALSANVPITIALVYASLVTYVNSLNANRKYKPWAFSKTSLFRGFVIIHNIILALYSAWTCIGMLNNLRISFVAFNGPSGVAGTVDALCKIHGPRGLGSAATYNASSSAWTMTNKAFHLAADGLGPESTDVGRIWNEGLAFYGWFFYLSKFYEVVDTFIILAKGKKSTFLQTYHHAGAMMAMWAGIRYMSPPIWMFVLVNSGIHTVMYTFYLCSALGVQIPKWFKQTLTTLQIAQFVVGASYAFLHLFISYQVSVSVPYLSHPGGIASKISSIVSADASTVSSAVASATLTAGPGAWLKKVALLAAGREGMAQNVVNEQGDAFGLDALHAAEDYSSRETTSYRDELQYVHCLDTSGQVFAILLNCMYLAPLTWLFARFFITAYLKRVERRRSSTASEKAAIARQSFRDATKGVSRQVSDIVDELDKPSEEIGAESEQATQEEIKKDFDDAAAISQSMVDDGKEKARSAAAKVDAKQSSDDIKGDLQSIYGTLQEKAKNLRLKKQEPDEQIEAPTGQRNNETDPVQDVEDSFEKRKASSDNEPVGAKDEDKEERMGEATSGTEQNPVGGSDGNGAGKSEGETQGGEDDSKTKNLEDDDEDTNPKLEKPVDSTTGNNGATPIEDKHEDGGENTKHEAESTSPEHQADKHDMDPESSMEQQGVASTNNEDRQDEKDVDETSIKSEKNTVEGPKDDAFDENAEHQQPIEPISSIEKQEDNSNENADEPPTEGKDSQQHDLERATPEDDEAKATENSSKDDNLGSDQPLPSTEAREDTSHAEHVQPELSSTASQTETSSTHDSHQMAGAKPISKEEVDQDVQSEEKNAETKTSNEHEKKESEEDNSATNPATTQDDGNTSSHDAVEPLPRKLLDNSSRSSSRSQLQHDKTNTPPKVIEDNASADINVAA